MSSISCVVLHPTIVIYSILVQYFANNIPFRFSTSLPRGRTKVFTTGWMEMADILFFLLYLLMCGGLAAATIRTYFSSRRMNPLHMSTRRMLLRSHEGVSGSGLVIDCDLL